jgi:hypothetical protein
MLYFHCGFERYVAINCITVQYKKGSFIHSYKIWLVVIVTILDENFKLWNLYISTSVSCLIFNKSKYYPQNCVLEGSQSVGSNS